MSDRSDEVTTSRESGASPPSRSRDPEALLEETDRLLEELENGPEADTGSVSASRSSSGSDFDADADANADDGGWRSWFPSIRSSESGSASRSVTGAFRSRTSFSDYFSPKAFLGFALAIVAGLVVGWFVVPIAGKMVGMFAIAFLLGLVVEQRRYLELTLAGISVGAASAIANHAILAIAGSGQAVAAVGATVGLLACLGGYYLGRDLRRGLSDDADRDGR